MPVPLMPKATAVWLVENTSLTFDQIAEFCGLHPLEVQAIADGEVANQMQGLDPVANGQTTAEEIARCQGDPNARLKLSPQAVPQQFARHRGPRYTPIAKRQDKPDAIMYLLRSHPELSEAQISKLIGTTKPTIAAVGFAPAHLADAARTHLADYLERGYHGDMGWLAEQAARRGDPQALWTEARTVVVLGLNYAPEDDPLANSARSDRGTISVYARSRDYH